MLGVEMFGYLLKKLYKFYRVSPCDWIKMAVLGVSFPVICVLLVCIATRDVLIVPRVLDCQGPVFCVILLQGSSKNEERCIFQQCQLNLV